MSSVLIGNNSSDYFKIERDDFENYTRSEQFVVSTQQNSCGSQFSGSVLIWCGQPDLQQFLKELRECEHTRRNEAKLQSQSPQEFSLRIWNRHSKGDFSLARQISGESAALRAEFE